VSQPSCFLTAATLALGGVGDLGRRLQLDVAAFGAVHAGREHAGGVRPHDPVHERTPRSDRATAMAAADRDDEAAAVDRDGRRR